MAKLLVIGGGGSGTSNKYGGCGYGSGGGAGQHIYDDNIVLVNGTYQIVVGKGGQNEADGETSSFNDIIAIGGKSNGTSGDGYLPGEYLLRTEPFTGPRCVDYSIPVVGGGGGGSTGSGETPTLLNNLRGNGGPGTYCDITGVNIYRAGGGGGGMFGQGQAGGGNGVADTDCGSGFDAVDGTGSGGGNAWRDQHCGIPPNPLAKPGKGGNGIVIVRFPTLDFPTIIASGGIIEYDGNDTVVTFPESGTLTLGTEYMTVLIYNNKILDFSNNTLYFISSTKP